MTHNAENDAPAFRIPGWKPGNWDWTHAEAKRRTLIERLYERCASYAQDHLPCPLQGTDLPAEDWCERCLAADALTRATPPAAGHHPGGLA